MLNELDIPKAMIDTELAAMTTHVVTKTANRSVVGMLNEFSFLGERFLAPDNDLHSLSIRLADTHADRSTNQRATPTAKCAYDSSAKHPNGSNAKTKPPTLDAKPASSETPTRRT